MRCRLKNRFLTGWPVNMPNLDASLQTVRSAFAGARPRCALVLGSGWGHVAESFAVRGELPYASIACLGRAGVAGHAGRLLWAEHAGRELLVFQGRRHWYEGAGWDPVAFPVYAALQLGARDVLLTNAAGGIRPDLAPGALMAIEDHINAMGVHPLVGPHEPAWGPRFPDQSQVYSPALRDGLVGSARELGIELAAGVYAAASGPTYETPAEIRALRAAGADAVGMSTVPEAILANAAGLRVAALSCITNHAAGVSRQPISHQEVLDVTARALPRMQRLLSEFLRRQAAAETEAAGRP